MKKLILMLVLFSLFSVNAFAGDLKPGGMQDKDMYNLFNNLNNSIMNGCMGDVGLAGAVSPNPTDNIRTTATVNYTIGGVWYSLGASANIDTATSLGGIITSQNALTYVKYMVCVNSSGAYKIIRGLPDAIAADALIGLLPSGYAAIGYFQVYTAASTTFKLGTTLLNATGITTTYVDLRAINSGKSAVSLTGL